MKVKQLIEILQRLPEDKQVLIQNPDIELICHQVESVSTTVFYDSKVGHVEDYVILIPSKQ